MNLNIEVKKYFQLALKWKRYAIEDILVNLIKAISKTRWKLNKWK